MDKNRRDKTFALVKSIFKAEKDIRMAVIRRRRKRAKTMVVAAVLLTNQTLRRERLYASLSPCPLFIYSTAGLSTGQNCG